MVGSILIADDDGEILRQLAEAFVRADFVVHEAADGDIACRLFPLARPDVALIDLLMPNREGLETIMAMRSVRQDVKIIAMSGGGRLVSVGVLALARPLGADAVLPKPFRPSAAVALAERMLGGEGSIAGRQRPQVATGLVSR